MVHVAGRACLGWWLVLAALSAAAPAQKIDVQYDQNLDYSLFKTFAWGGHDAVARPVLAIAIAGAIEDELTKRGLTKVADHPDLYIKMYGSVDHDMSLSDVDPLYGTAGIPPFESAYRLWSNMPGGTPAVTVHKGQLVVDLIDASQKKLVWRGVAKEKLSDQRSKLVDQVNKAVEKMFQQYPVKKQ
jgi:hypothetical protein